MVREHTIVYCPSDIAMQYLSRCIVAISRYGGLAPRIHFGRQEKPISIGSAFHLDASIYSQDFPHVVTPIHAIADTQLLNLPFQRLRTLLVAKCDLFLTQYGDQEKVFLLSYM